MRTFDERFWIDEFTTGLLEEKPFYLLLWIGLFMTMADDQGRMLDNAAEIKARIFPSAMNITSEFLNDGLALFESKHKILRYVAGNNGSGRRLIQVVNWWRYQKSARYAARSQYPAPPKWIDRICSHEPGSGQQTIKVNWDKEGGFSKGTIPSQLLQKSFTTAAVLPHKSREDDVDVDVDLDDEEKNLPTTLPPSSPRAQKAAGGKAGPKHQEPLLDLKDLKPKQKKAAEQIARIFRSSGLSGKKIDTIIYQVAIRSSLRDPIAYTLAAIASAYADPTANKKPSVAAYRMQIDQVDPNYLKPDRWIDLPENILKAAGIEDIESYVKQKKIENFTA